MKNMYMSRISTVKFDRKTLSLWRWWFVVACILTAFVDSTEPLGRREFPHGFIFGTASSAYQYEGAAREGGKGPSIWDIFSHLPGKIADGSNGDVAVDQYHRYKEDVKLMKNMGMDAYRFSISWPRILPYGTVKHGINKVGIAYYNNLINELLKNDIKPFVTLFHWDVPQALEDKYGGFLNQGIVNDFASYAEVCFREFGDRVKHWITLNEPLAIAASGYDSGGLAPGRHSGTNGNISTGNSATEPYIVTHNLLLAHAAAVRVYKRKYQAVQKGVIGITLMSYWMLPYSTNSVSDQKAARRAFDFMFGWFMDPITKGEYPSTMRNLVGARLPKFSKRQSFMLKGSFDFLGVNYYTTRYASLQTPPNPLNTSYTLDSQVNLTAERNGVAIGPVAGSNWLYVYPPGIRELLVHIKHQYNNPLVFITENGIDEINNESLPLKKALNDTWRIDYHSKHLAYVEEAIRGGSDIRGYFAWSLLDNFEWGNGYTVRFGLYYVDFKNGLKRHPKASAHWFTKFLKRAT